VRPTSITWTFPSTDVPAREVVFAARHAADKLNPGTWVITADDYNCSSPGLCQAPCMDSKARRARTLCALCESAPSTPEGEHVLPRHLTRKLFRPSRGPYTTTSASGSTTTDPKFDAVKLACCQLCNDRLNQRFEDRKAQPAMRLLSEDEPVLDAGQTTLAALWFLKTWPLLAHPRTEYQAATPAPTARWDGVASSVWSWAVRDEDPPLGLSAWAFRHRQDGDGDEPPPSAPRLELPHVVADGVAMPFYVIDLTLELVNVSVVWHPGWQIEHLAAAAGEVLQLSPLPVGTTIDRLPDLDHRPIRWATGPVLRFLPGTYDGTLPPLTPGVPPSSQVTDRLESADAGPPVAP